MAKLKEFRLVDSKSKVCECHYISIYIYIYKCSIYFVYFFFSAEWLSLCVKVKNNSATLKRSVTSISFSNG